MKYDAEGVAAAGANAAHAMPHSDTIHPARATGRTVVHGKNDGIALAERHHLGARLHARALLSEDKFSSREGSRRREQDGHLKRKDKIAINVLVETVIIAGAIGQQQGRGLGLSGIVAALQIGSMGDWIADIGAEGFIPAVGNGSERG